MIAQILSGHTEAFRTLVDQYYSYVYKIVYGIVKNHYDTEDIVQEVFVQVYKSLLHYRYEGFNSWIKRIAINKAIDFKRRIVKMPLHDSIDEVASSILLTDSEQIEATLVRKERISRVQEELSLIPESYQAIIQSFYIEEKTYAEISEELGIELKTVESKLYRARKWLKQHWSREEF